MKRLLQILAGGFVAFMVLAIGQEWEIFATAWFGKAAPEIVLTEEDRAGAVAAVRMTLELTGHLYANDGDPRFAERMPASERLVEALMKDIDYLANNHRRQHGRLERLDVVAVRALAPGRLEVRTREQWLTRILWLDGREAAAPVAGLVHARYLVVEGGQGWTVEDWDFDRAREEEEASPT